MKTLKHLFMLGLFGMISMGASAEVKWLLNDTGTLFITGSGNMMNYVEGYAPWYSYRSNIKSLFIEDQITSIGDNAFYGCSGLTSVTIGNSVAKIGDGAFYGCSGLTSVTIPNSVTEIGYSAFGGCTGLKEPVYNIKIFARFPISLKGDYDIPQGIITIAHDAFKGCFGLTGLTIPNSVTSIGHYAFDSCYNVKKLIYAEGTKTILSTGLKSITSVTIPNSVTSIGEWAFSGCSGLTSVTIPNSVTSIGKYVFYGCSGLTSVTIPNSVTEIGYSAFWGCTGLKEPVYNNKIFARMPINSKGEYDIPHDIITIASGAFEGCSGLTRVTIPKSVTEIGSWAFSGCNNVKELIYAEGTKTVLRTGITSITSVSIPNTVTSISDYAFDYCSDLMSVTIPDSVTSIGNRAFLNCSNLTRVTIPNSVTSIGEGAFSYCSGLTSVTIGNSVTEIGNYVFEDCSSLTSVIIPNSVTKILNKAFNGCLGLTNVYVKWEDASKIARLYYGNEFPYYNCDLYVPIGTKEIYQGKDGWKDFRNIYEYELESVSLGDANDDGSVNVNDITTIATYILNGTATPWNEKNADANQDGSINVNDITATAGIILNGDDDDETTCADVISGPDGKIYRVTGTCTAITNTQYGNWYLNDGTGEVYIYGTLDAKGQTKNFLSLGIEVGDVITVEGPKNTYNTTVELVDVTVINIQKSLVKVDSLTVDGVKNDHVGVEGGNIVVHLTCNGDVVNVEIPEETKEWLSVASVTSGPNPIVTLDVATNTGGDRNATIVFKTHSNKKEYTAQATIYQKGSIQEVSVADFLAAPVGDAQYRLTGVIVNVANESYGNCTIRDYSGEVYVYGIGAKGDFGKLGLKAGDIVTLVGQRGAYNDSPQMAKGKYESHKPVTQVTVAEFLTKPDDANVYYMVNGEITTIDNPTYGNCHIKDGDSELYVYGCYPGWGATGDARKNFMATAGIEVGDRLTVIGPKTTYGTTIELNGGIYFSHQKP